MLTLVLSRHGATPRSEPEQHLGQRVDIELSEPGRQAAEALARRLAGVSFDRLISSPLRRARETAAAIANGRPVETDARLLEMDYGDWEGLTYGEIEARFGDERRRWEADPASGQCPGGESGLDVATRASGFLEDAVTTGGQVLVVAHSTLNRVLLCVALGVELREYRRRFRQEPANLTVLRFPGSAAEGAQLLLCNDVAHLRGTSGVTWG